MTSPTFSWNGADLRFESTPTHAYALMALRETGGVVPEPAGDVKIVARGPDLAVALCNEVTPRTLQILREQTETRLAVYSPRPDTVQELLQGAEHEVNSYSIHDFLMRGQSQTVA